MQVANPKHNNKTKPYIRTQKEDILPEQEPQVKYKSALLITLEGNHINQTQPSMFLTKSKRRTTIHPT